MQIKLPPENIDNMLNNARCEINYRSENLIVAKKSFDHGKISIRLMRYSPNYLLNERYYWLANIHFEFGTRPQRLFNSDQVIEFVQKFVKPYTG